MNGIIIFVYVLAGVLLLIALGIVLFRYIRYRRSEYFISTRNPFLSVYFNKGRLGEYYSYLALRKLDEEKKFFFNLYIPKGEGRTTEADVVLLDSSGLYVIESKNYSGWIFGRENEEYWTQSILTGDKKNHHNAKVKNRFYNPIRQNIGHINALKELIKDDGVPLYSVVAFSNRCTLKKIILTSGDHIVVNRSELARTVEHIRRKSPVFLSLEKRHELANLLEPYSKVDQATKDAHIRDIESRYKKK